jgi:DNA-binding MarR family transcriptional regulator
MQPNEIRELVQEAISDDQALPYLSREIGQQLALNRLEILDELRTALEKASREAGDYARGFLEAMAEMVRAYQAEVMPRKEDESIIALTKRQARWGPALKAMENGPVLPTELRTRLDEAELELSSVSRLLKDMREVGLVELFSSPGVDGRMRPHHLTLLGRRVLAGLSNESQNTVDPAATVRPVQEEDLARPPVAKRPGAEARHPRMVTTIPQVARWSSTGS